MRDDGMDDAYVGDERDAARCPVPAWALRPLAVALPVVAVVVVLWLVLHR